MSGLLLARRMGGAKTAIALPAIGDAWLGGYFAGVIDTTRGNIIAADAFQTGLRYAVIVAPASLDATGMQYKTSNTLAPAQARTLWNGLGATAAMNSAIYPAAYYCAGRTTPPGDDASAWYLPARDELELVYRNLKPVTTSNSTSSTAVDFPPNPHADGDNASSIPPGSAYTSSIPAQTAVTTFRSGGAQAMSAAYYYCATESTSAGAWIQSFSTASSGAQIDSGGKSGTGRVRPVRRLVL